MANVYEVLAGTLNLREAPGGPVLATLARGDRLEETGDAATDADNVRWLAVTLMPQGSLSGYICARYASPVDALGQQGPQATQSLDVTRERLLRLTPTAKDWIVTQLAENFAQVQPYGILSSARRLCHFLAQAAHESAGFRTLEEFGGAAYWSRYEGRADLGNTQRGDGVRYHGRGIFQLTGRANYRRMGGRINVALEDDPDLAADADVSLSTACEYWKSRKLEVPADVNDIEEVTRRVNGGDNGLAERRMYYRRAWSIWGTLGEPSGV